MKSNEIFIRCECSGHGLGVERDEEAPLYYFSYWGRGLSSEKLTFRERIRHCWQVLTKGRAFNDEIILGQQSVDELVSFLNKNRDGFPVGNTDFGTNME